jgi:signal transduction histidine kinase
VRLGSADPEEELVAALLRNLGILILSEVLPEEYDCVLCQTPEVFGRRRCELEREALGVSHPEVAALLLGRWGLSDEITEAIRHQFDPARAAGLPPPIPERTRLLHFAGLVGQLQLTPEHRGLVPDLIGIAGSLGLSIGRLEDFLQPLPEVIAEFASLIQVDIGPCPSLADRLKEATEQLTRITVETAQENLQVRAEIGRMEQARQQTESMFHQAQKMEVVGRLAGGVAHDFNNFLTIIVGYADLLRCSLEPDSPLQEFVTEIKDSAERATALTRQLLAFSRRQQLAPVMLDLNSLIRDMEKMLRRLLGEPITLKCHLGAALPQVRMDPGQVEQILLNLAANARDAMPEGGTFTVATAPYEVTAASEMTGPQLPLGSYALLTVSDTGCGMSDEVRAHLFEPFYTTKEIGKGTGLGLATVYGIVGQSDGLIQVVSAPGQGTQFEIYLPVATEANAVHEPEEPGDSTLRGAATVLLVEDEVSVRHFARRILEGKGFKVLEAGNGQEALTLSKRYRDPIHVLVTDVFMPFLGGIELNHRLAKLRPGIKTLFISGYVDRPFGAPGGPDLNFLPKPFTPRALVQSVEALL